jgi:formate--tetrahydrofolate ligase
MFFLTFGYMMTTPHTDIEIARSVPLKPIANVAQMAGIPQDALLFYGTDKAKLSLKYLKSLEPQSPGKLILVTAINPTPAGEGKTTTTIGLLDAIRKLGKRALACLREPSLGPCFGMKGGAAGGGYAQVAPMDAINLHFTGDFHAITSAHNLMAALLDNQLHWGNPLNVDARRVSWTRVMDMNDRALRNIVIGLGGKPNGVPREDGFDITVASEIMAILCLANDYRDFEARLRQVVVAYDNDGKPVTATELKAVGAMMALLKDAFLPNLAQTLEHNAVLIHGGPFANIALGCNSVIATKTALKLADYVVTEAGFGADLGAEKFFDIKCRQAGLTPSAAVVVATVRALKMHGGVAKEDLGTPDPEAVRRGCANLLRHLENVKKFGVPVVVAVNHFNGDTDEEFAVIRDAATPLGVDVCLCTHWANGGAGAVELAEKVLALADSDAANFKPLYPSSLSLVEKTRTIAREIYGATEISLNDKAAKRFAQLEQEGHGDKPVCIAKTQYSFSTDPQLRGAPTGHIVPVRDVRLCAGAGFVVAICGDIMTMPGLPRRPAAEGIYLNEDGEIEGLF